MKIYDLIPLTVYGWKITLYFFLTLTTVLVIAELSARLFKLPKEFARKLIHISVGLLVVLFSFYLSSPEPLLFLCLVFSVTNFFVKKYNLVPSMNCQRDTYGTIYYPLAILVSIILFWHNYKFIFINIILIMALADAFAAIAGQSIKNPVRYKVWNDWKSIQGSVVFFIITYIVIIITFYFLKPVNNVQMHFSVFLTAFLLGIVITLAESISSKGSDNFSISFMAGFFFYIFFYSDVFYQVQFTQAIIFSALIALISIRFHFLNIDGAVATAFIALFIFGIGGWSWTIPVLTFFITASMLSKVGKKHKYKFRLLFEKSSKRDSKQVFANGGIALIMVLLFFFIKNDMIYYLYLISLAAANADTWATEIGVFSRSKPRLITTFKKVEKGRSGAVSLAGSIAAVGGSIIIIISGFILSAVPSASTIFFLALFGFLASLTDSLLGATIQAQYLIEKPAVITEKAFNDQGNPNKLVRGFKWLNNDRVNFISISFASLLYFFIYLYL